MADNGGGLLDVLRSRKDILQTIKQGPMSKPELVDACDVSRSTIDRGIGTLESAGVVTRGDRGRYELTLFGRVLLRELGRALDRMDRLNEVGPFLEEIDGHAGIDAEFFDDAAIQFSKGVGIATIIETFHGATDLRIVDPPFYLVFLWLASESGPPVDGEVAMFLRDDVLAEVSTYNPSLVETYVERDIDIFELTDPPPFSFALVDRSSQDSVCLILGNRKEGLAVIETQSSEAVAWGRDLFEETAEAAKPVTVETIQN